MIDREKDKSFRVDLLRLWGSKGLSSRASRVLEFAGCENEEDVRSLGPNHFLSHSNIGKVTVREIGRVLFGEQWGPRPRVSLISDAALIRELRQRGYRVLNRKGQRAFP